MAHPHSTIRDSIVYDSRGLKIFGVIHRGTDPAALENLQQRLMAAGVPLDVVPIADGDHVFFTPALQRQVIDTTVAWIQRALHAQTGTTRKACQPVNQDLAEAAILSQFARLGPSWMVPDLDASWQDGARREVILDIARLAETEPVLGPRLVAVARKPYLPERRFP